MDMDPMVEETLRDIRAAKVELSGRRDQILGEYNERIASLDRLSDELRSGQTEPRAAQAQVRKLIAADKTKPTLTRSAGRTMIGMPPSAAQSATLPTGSPSRATNTGPIISAARALAAVQKMLDQVDRRLVQLMASARRDTERREARLELSFLLQLRRSLEAHHHDLPNDVILLTSVVEFTDHAQLVLSDLEAGGPERVLRLLEHDRLLAAELVALGGTVKGLKEKLVTAKSQLGESDSALDQALGAAVEVFGHLQSELEKRFPLAEPSLLEDALRP